MVKTSPDPKTVNQYLAQLADFVFQDNILLAGPLLKLLHDRNEKIRQIRFFKGKLEVTPFDPGDVEKVIDQGGKGVGADGATIQKNFLVATQAAINLFLEKVRIGSDPLTLGLK